MAENDFERYWLKKFSKCLDDIAGKDIRTAVMQGSQTLSSDTDPVTVIDWTQEAMERLEALVDEESRKAILTGCACQYPKSDLGDIKQAFQETGDIDLAHRMLQEKFETFLAQFLDLDDDLMREVIDLGWGLAGVKQGDTILATKIPKSGYLIEYMREKDPARKRQLYCHCPRMREALKQKPGTLSSTYCYCGAGFYKGIWEEILTQPVQVEVLESVLQGDEVCKIAIHLPVE